MSSKRNRQTFEKMRREQAVRKRRDEKRQRKAERRAAKALDQASSESVAEAAAPPEQVEPGSVTETKNGSGLREAPSLRVHQQ